MPAITIGRADFDYKKTGTLTEAINNMFTRHCSPPPSGSLTRYQWSPEVNAHWLMNHFQPHEVVAVLTASGLASNATLLKQVEAGIISFNSLAKIDESNLPAAWHERSSCFDTTVGFAVEYDVYEITAKAREAIQLGGLTYPAGDTLGVFRLARPVSYHFTRSFVWNPACCMGDPRIRDMEKTESFPTYADYKKWHNGLRIGVELKWDHNHLELWKIPYFPKPEEDENR